jgi:putative sigma-54 modulation protein
MSLHLTYKDIESTPAIKDYTEKKVEKFKKYITYPMEIHVLLSVHKGEHSVEITCHAEHKQLVGIAKSENLYNSIDGAVTKIETQMKKEREKKKGHAAASKAAHRGIENAASDVDAIIPHRSKR